MKQNDLQTAFTFNPSNQIIRVEMISNEPWFVAKDVCDVLEHSNHKVAVQMLDDDERGVRKVYPLNGKGGIQEAIIINESGLYNLIFRSNKPEAKTFRKWVTSEVLPVLRKTGKYTTPTQPITRYVPENNIELSRTMQIAVYRELLQNDTEKMRRNVANLIDFYVSQIK